LTLVYSCIAPHGGELIPDLVSSSKVRSSFATTRIGMKKIARDIKRARPKTIIIASPHNLRLLNHICVVVSENSSGKLTARRGHSVSVKAKCDVPLARKILAAAEETNLPVIGANYGTFEGPSSDLPMDWGTLVPLWFFERTKPKPRIVIVSPSREIPLRLNYDFGKIIANECQKEEKRIVFVASADQAHAHKKSGPYGFHESAKVYDEAVKSAIVGNRIDSLLDLDPGFVEQAKPDSLWQLAILAGILGEVRSEPKLYSYQVPTYFGTICASFFPAQS
jgi:aromatic ring-opening dioxygenase LigB subunit